MELSKLAASRAASTGLWSPNLDNLDLPKLIDSLPLAAYACDAAGRILWFNSRAKQLWGRAPALRDNQEKFCGSYKLFFEGQFTPKDQCPMASALRTGKPVLGVEGKLERPDGSNVWVSVHIEPLQNEFGELVGAINCFHETTALHEAADDLEDFFENSAVGLHIVSSNGAILRANAAELRMLGYEAKEYIGKNIADIHADRSTIDDILARLRRAEPVTQYPARLRAKDGSIKHVLITSNARVKDGEFVHTRCLTTDVTEQKLAEDALRHRVDAQEALYELTARLQRAESSDEIFQAALDAITRALGCQRSAILLHDPAGVMQFASWRGLSVEYRSAVAGHSPWSTPPTTEPAPITLDDVSSAVLPDELKRSVLREGIQALAFIPLFESGRLLGKFMAYYDRPHHFTEADLNLALTIARQLSFSLERLRSTQAAQHLVAIVESSEDAIISKDLNGIVKTWNAGAERLFGYTADEVIGRPLALLIPAERSKEEPDILSRIRRGEKVDHYETVRQHKNGALLDISITVSPVRDATGRIVGASNISRDVSSQKVMEAKLRESERQLQDLLAAIPAAIYTTDAQGKITYFNQAAVELAGREPAIGSDEWCVTWKLFRPDGSPLPHAECPMAVTLKEGRAIRDAEAIAERPDGTRIPFIPYPTPLLDVHGKVVGAINMLVDISERRQAESHQRMLLNELNHRVKNNMQMMQALLDAGARGTKSEEARRVLGEAGRRISAMAAAQRSLYGSTDAARFKCAEFLTAVTGAVRETLLTEAEIICEGADGELSNDVAMPLALILNELLTNAAKHGANGVITVGLTEHNDLYSLYVQDDGCGFDLDVVRGKSSGLRLVQGLARQLGGQFEVTRNPTRCIVSFKKVRHDA